MKTTCQIHIIQNVSIMNNAITRPLIVHLSLPETYVTKDANEKDKNRSSHLKHCTVKNLEVKYFKKVKY